MPKRNLDLIVIYGYQFIKRRGNSAKYWSQECNLITIINSMRWHGKKTNLSQTVAHAANSKISIALGKEKEIKQLNSREINKIRTWTCARSQYNRFRHMALSKRKSKATGIVAKTLAIGRRKKAQNSSQFTPRASARWHNFINRNHAAKKFCCARARSWARKNAQDETPAAGIASLRVDFRACVWHSGGRENRLKPETIEWVCIALSERRAGSATWG